MPFSVSFYFSFACGQFILRGNSLCLFLQDWFDKWVETDTKKGRFNKAILQVAIHKQRAVRKMPIFRSCDLNAMVTVVDPDVVMDTTEVFATVELQGKYTKGMMVVDWNARLGRKPNVRLIRQLDTTKARVHFDKMML